MCAMSDDTVVAQKAAGVAVVPTPGGLELRIPVMKQVHAVVDGTTAKWDGRTNNNLELWGRPNQHVHDYTHYTAGSRFLLGCVWGEAAGMCNLG